MTSGQERQSLADTLTERILEDKHPDLTLLPSSCWASHWPNPTGSQRAREHTDADEAARKMYASELEWRLCDFSAGSVLPSVLPRPPNMLG